MNYILITLLSSFLYGILPFFDRIILKNTILNPLTIIYFSKIISSFNYIVLYFFISHKLDTYIKLLEQYNKNYFIFLLIIITSFIGLSAFILYFISLANSKNSYFVITATYALPVIIFSLLNYLFFDENLSNINIFGILMIIIGIYMVSHNKNMKYFI